MMVEETDDRSAAALGISGGAAESRPWYLGATPLATLPWLIRLRWTTAAIEAVVVGVAWAFPWLDLPLDHIAPVILAAAFVNVVVAVGLSRGQPLPRAFSLAALMLDGALLVGLLDLTGGPFNPFSVILVAQVTLAALTLGSLPAALLGGFSAAGFGLLVHWHLRDLDPVHHRLNDFPTHLFTMWIAVATTAELVAYFVVQTSDALARREKELEAMRQRAARNERLVSLTTLAAGAAHELSTPLATIALASRELEHAADARGTVPDLAEDARLIRAEVDRCQAILDQMSGRAGGTTADDPESVDPEALVTDLRARLTVDQCARLQVHLPKVPAPVFLPRAGLSQAVLSLVKNAFDATADDRGAPVVIELSQDHDCLRVTVADRGPGMSADTLKRIGEPFFTTKEPGRGLGLGLFLARVFAERVGGGLTVTSNNGTTACLELPLRAEAPHAGRVSF
jgi:two-component system sensor histidine kinase RegB